MIFLFTSDDCPLHSFTALSEISAISKRAAGALAPRRAEHLRLLKTNLEADHQLDVEMARERELDAEADAFWDNWSIDSDGHWHDRFEQRYAAERPQYYFEIYDNVDLRVRRLEIAMPLGVPILPPSQLVLQPFHEDGPASMEISRAHPISPQGRDASPMNVASTVPADFDPTLPPLRPLPDLDDHDLVGEHNE